jgi:diketogulonate reductase-like aldo/keto reductase
VVREGKSRAWGLSGEVDAIDAILSSRPAAPQVSQVSASVADSRDWNAHTRIGAWKDAVVMAHQPFGGGQAYAVVSSSLRRASRSASSDLAQMLATLDADLVTDFLLNGLLVGGPADVVLAASYNLEHIARNARVVGASRFTKEQLAYLRAEVLRDLHGSRGPASATAG